jgi:hypothetical protein
MIKELLKFEHSMLWTLKYFALYKYLEKHNFLIITKKTNCIMHVILFFTNIFINKNYRTCIYTC